MVSCNDDTMKRDIHEKVPIAAVGKPSVLALASKIHESDWPVHLAHWVRCDDYRAKELLRGTEPRKTVALVRAFLSEQRIMPDPSPGDQTTARDTSVQQPYATTFDDTTAPGSQAPMS